MTGDELLTQIMAAARASLPAWVPRSAFDAFVSANRARLAARLEPLAARAAPSPRKLAAALARGTEIEIAEHGFDRETARMVARDHLEIDPAAYDKAKMPAKPKRAGRKPVVTSASLSRQQAEWDARDRPGSEVVRTSDLLAGDKINTFLGLSTVVAVDADANGIAFAAIGGPQDGKVFRRRVEPDASWVRLPPARARAASVALTDRFPLPALVAAARVLSYYAEAGPAPFERAWSRLVENLRHEGVRRDDTPDGAAVEDLLVTGGHLRETAEGLVVTGRPLPYRVLDGAVYEFSVDGDRAYEAAVARVEQESEWRRKRDERDHQESADRERALVEQMTAANQATRERGARAAKPKRRAITPKEHFAAVVSRKPASTMDAEFITPPGDIVGRLDVRCDGATLNAAATLAKKAAPKGSHIALITDGDNLYLVVRHNTKTYEGHMRSHQFVVRLAATVSARGAAWFDAGGLAALLGHKGQVSISGDDDHFFVKGQSARQRVPSVERGNVVRESTPHYPMTWDSQLARMAFETVLPFASRDESRVNLIGIQVGPAKGRSNSVAFVSTDGHRLMLFDADLPHESQGMIWRAEAASAMPTLLKDSGQILVDMNANRAIVAGATASLSWTLITPAHQVVFPPYEQVIPKNLPFSCSIVGAEALPELQALVRFIGPEYKLPNTVWSLSAHELRISYTDADGGQAVAMIPLTCQVGEDNRGSSIGLNPLYALDVFKTAAFQGKVTLALHFAGTETSSSRYTLEPLRMDASSDNWRATAVVMPMRTDVPELAGTFRTAACGPAVRRSRLISEPIRWLDGQLDAEVHGAALAKGARFVVDVLRESPERVTGGVSDVAVLADGGRMSLVAKRAGLGVRVDIPATVSAPGADLVRPAVLMRAAAALEKETCVLVSSPPGLSPMRVSSGSLSYAIGASSLSRATAAADYLENNVSDDIGGRIPSALAAMAFAAAAEVGSSPSTGKDWSQIYFSPVPDGVAIMGTDGAMLIRVELAVPWSIQPMAVHLPLVELAAANLATTQTLDIAVHDNWITMSAQAASPFEWAIFSPVTGPEKRLDKFVAEHAESDFACTVLTDNLKPTLTSIRRTAQRSKRVDGDTVDSVDVELRSDGLTLRLEEQTWTVPLECPPRGGIVARFNLQRLLLFLGLKTFAGRKVTLELSEDTTRPLRMTSSGSGWRAVAFLMQNKPVTDPGRS